MAQTITPVSVLVAGAGNATMATAITAANAATVTAVTAAKIVANVDLNSIKVIAGGLIFDGTLYVGYSTVQYRTIVTS